MARRALWRSGAAKDVVPRLAHLDRDRSLVEDAKRDPARFDALYRRYLARVYSYAYYELGDHHLAEDATEATFVSALTNLHRFEERARPADGDGASTFRVWLFQIARNEVAGERRRLHRRPTEPIGETMLTDPLDVESAAVRRDEARAAWRAVGRLPGERRQAMVLRFVDELSTAEIAGVLGRSEGAVRVLIHRALKSVAREMGEAKAPRASTRSTRDGGTSGTDA